MTRRPDTTGETIASFSALVLQESKRFKPGQVFHVLRTNGLSFPMPLKAIVSMAASLVNQSERGPVDRIPKVYPTTKRKRGKGAKRLGPWTQARPLKRARAKR